MKDMIRLLIREVERTDSTDGMKSVIVLEQALNMLEDCTAMVDAAIRRISRRVPTMLWTDPIDWVETELNNLDVAYINVRAKNTASMLMRALDTAALLTLIPKPAIIEGPIGTVLVEWTPDISWLIYSSSFAWPLLKVRMYVSEPGCIQSDARSYYHAKSLIDATLEAIRSNIS